MRPIYFLNIAGILALFTSCSGTTTKEASNAPKVAASPSYFHVDPTTAGTVSGAIRFTGKKPVRKAVDMSNDPACAEAHHGKAYDESLVVNANGTLANVFIYIKSGLEGKTFESSKTPVAIDQHGCWFNPRVLGIQTGQTFQVTNSDPVTHSIHPLAQVNREWNHSQGPGEAPLVRSFVKPEVMIRVKCNIHSWMHAYIGVVEHPYFAVTERDGSFELKGVPPGNYVIQAWHEKLGTQEQNVTLPSSGKVKIDFTFTGE